MNGSCGFPTPPHVYAESDFDFGVIKCIWHVFIAGK